MQLADLLTDFSPTIGHAAHPIGDGEADKTREAQELATFDQGYRDGWDDAMRAMEDESKRLHSDLAQNLRDLSFTYREAYGHILTAMEPLLSQMIETILPAALQDSLGHHIVERLSEHARMAGECPVQIAVSPQEQALIAPFLDGDMGFPVSVVGDDTLIPGQADLRFGAEHEERIDLTEIATEIREAITSVSMETRRTAHG